MMMKILPLLLFIIALINVGPTVYADGDIVLSDAKKIDVLSKSDFSIIDKSSGIAISFLGNIGDIIKDFGDPNEVFIGPNASDSKWDDLVYKYPSFWTSAYRGWMNIVYLWVQTDQFSTSRGISVGNSLEDMLEKYGQSDYSKNGRYIYQLELEETSGYWILRFKIENGVIVDILMNISD